MGLIKGITTNLKLQGFDYSDDSFKILSFKNTFSLEKINYHSTLLSLNGGAGMKSWINNTLSILCTVLIGLIILSDTPSPGGPGGDVVFFEIDQPENKTITAAPLTLNGYISLNHEKEGSQGFTIISIEAQTFKINADKPDEPQMLSDFKSLAVTIVEKSAYNREFTLAFNPDDFGLSSLPDNTQIEIRFRATLAANGKIETHETSLKSSMKNVQ